MLQSPSLSSPKIYHFQTSDFASDFFVWMKTFTYFVHEIEATVYLNKIL